MNRPLRRAAINLNLDAVRCGSLPEIRAAAPGCFALKPVRLAARRLDRVDPITTPRGVRPMNYPLLPADAAAYAWQLSCCFVTLLFAMFSWMIGPR